MIAAGFGARSLGAGLRRAVAALALVALAGTTPLSAQVREVDPNEAIDADLGTPPPATAPSSPADSSAVDPGPQELPPADGTDPSLPPADTTGSQAARDATQATPTSDTYQEDDLIGAAEGVFGKGAKGIAGVIQDILKKQGQPNAYISGREGGGAFVVGLRYGSGTLFHKVEGQKPVYWTGPSVGFDAGANAGSTFVLVYNLYDSEDLFKRFPAGEGAAYLVGGFNVSYLRKGDVVLIPIRLGVGVRLGANVGYMKFSKKQNWQPF